ncbi:MAG: aminotransferase class IV [Thermodesulfovibrio sp.]|nr:aminotransferase class IV [Thermodesulfovibrio sp.]MDW7998624.1 aminotransferase class IV [Thermodesulfovibrio sp.]
MQNRTTLYGEGIFETIFWKGRTKKLCRHYERLKSSAQFFQIPCPDYETFCREIEKRTKNKKELYVKFCLLSKGKNTYHAYPKKMGTLIIIKSYKPDLKPKKLFISDIKRHSKNPVIYHKTMNYLTNILVKRDALLNNFDDAIILNEKDEITECSSSNIILVKGGKLLTPARECGLLLGTTLQLLIDNTDVKEERLKIEDIYSAKAIFITNSLIGILPVFQVMDRNYPIDYEILNYLKLTINKEN